MTDGGTTGTPEPGADEPPNPYGPAVDLIDELALVRSGGVVAIDVDYLESWGLWWDLNQHGIVALRERLDVARVSTGSADFFLGQGEANPRSSGAAEAKSWVRESLGRELLRVLDEEENPALLAESLVAVGRVFAQLDAETRSNIEGAIARLLESSSRDVRHAACLAAGLTGSHRFASVLGNVLSDNPAGRRAIGGGSVDAETRAIAAYGLGFNGAATEREDVRRYIVHVLDRVLGEVGERRADVHVACLLSLSMVPLETVGVRDPGGRPEPASASRLALLRRLIELLESDVEPSVKLHVPSALARVSIDLSADAQEVARSAVASALIDSLSSPRSQRAEYPSAVAHALGFLGRPTNDPLDVRTIATLEDLVDSGRFGTNFRALAALGRIAGAPGQPEVRARIGEALEKRVRRASGQERCWSSIALGLAGRALRDRGERVPSAWSLALVESLASSRQPEQFAAAAVACAMFGADGAGEPVLEGFEKLPEDASRAAVAIALGLLQAHDAARVIDNWSERVGQNAAAIYGSTVALELLHCTDLVAARLGDEFRAGRSGAAVATARGLSEIDEPWSHVALIAWLADTTRPAVVRAAAARALGRAGEARELPAHSVLAEVVCYECAPRTLFDGVGGGVLDMLR